MEEPQPAPGPEMAEPQPEPGPHEQKELLPQSASQVNAAEPDRSDDEFEQLPAEAAVGAAVNPIREALAAYAELLFRGQELGWSLSEFQQVLQLRLLDQSSGGTYQHALLQAGLDLPRTKQELIKLVEEQLRVPAPTVVHVCDDGDSHQHLYEDHEQYCPHPLCGRSRAVARRFLYFSPLDQNSVLRSYLSNQPAMQAMLFNVRRAREHDWRTGDATGIYAEAADGSRFLDFRSMFEESPANQLFALYYDGFPPFDNDLRTVHAFYLVPIGLSVADKANRDNWILLAMLSGLPSSVVGKQSPLDWNIYLRRLVDDLKSLAAEGIMVDVAVSDPVLQLAPGKQRVRLALYTALGDEDGLRDIFKMASCSSIGACRYCNQRGNTSVPHYCSFTSSASIPRSPEDVLAAASRAEAAQQSLNSGEGASKAAATRCLTAERQEHGVIGLSVFWELNEVYTGLWGPTATFLPDDVAYDFFHGLKNGARPMLQEIFRKEGELKGGHGQHTASVRAEELKFPIGRDNRRPSKPHQYKAWSGLQQMQMVGETLPVLVVGLVEEQMFQLVVKSAECMRLQWRESMTPAQLDEADIKLQERAVLHDEVLGHWRFNITQHAITAHFKPLVRRWSAPLVTSTLVGERKNGKFAADPANATYPEVSFARRDALSRALDFYFAEFDARFGREEKRRGELRAPTTGSASGPPVEIRRIVDPSGGCWKLPGTRMGKFPTGPVYAEIVRKLSQREPQLNASLLQSSVRFCRQITPKGQSQKRYNSTRKARSGRVLPGDFIIYAQGAALHYGQIDFTCELTYNGAPAYITFVSPFAVVSAREQRRMGSITNGCGGVTVLRSRVEAATLAERIIVSNDIVSHLITCQDWANDFEEWQAMDREDARKLYLAIEAWD